MKKLDNYDSPLRGKELQKKAFNFIFEERNETYTYMLAFHSFVFVINFCNFLSDFVEVVFPLIFLKCQCIFDQRMLFLNFSFEK